MAASLNTQHMRAVRLLSAPILPMVALAGAAMGWRAWYAAQFSDLLDCDRCLVAPTVANEAQPFLILICLGWGISKWLPRGIVVLRLAAIGLLCLSWADIATQRTFATRLSWHEVRKFWSEAGALIDFAHIMATWALKAVLALLGSVGVAGVSACMLAISVAAPEADTHRYYVRGSLSTFVQTPTRHTPYPQDWLTLHAEDLRSAQSHTCHPPNPPLGVQQVILVVVESLSSYQSRGFGGVHDWTPRLDEWARKGWQFTHFLANGKTTEDGLYALLTGNAPLPAPGLASMYAQPLDASRTLPALLTRQGFHTAFLTSGDLSFMQKGAWLERAGFAEIEGHDAPFYEGHPRYHFSAARDDVLYDRALQWITQRQANQTTTSSAHSPDRYLLVLETVSSHQPFYDPINNRISTEGAFRYADAALGRFLDRLQATRFLDSGLVIITSDHRAMIPAMAQEKAHMGSRHLSRIPLVLLGPGIPSGKMEEARTYSQQDLLPSLSAMLTGQAPCTAPWQGFFTPTTTHPPACVASTRAPSPNSVFLQCGRRDYEVRLNAHQSRYVDAPLSSSEARQYLQLIHAQRLSLPAAP